MEYIKMLVSAFVGALGAWLFSWVASKPKQGRERAELMEKRMEKTEEGIKALLRSEIQKEYLRIVKRGFTKDYEKKNVFELYKAYQDLGGNEYISDLYDQIMHLPVEKG